MLITLLALMGALVVLLKPLQHGFYIIHIALVAGIGWLLEQQPELQFAPFTPEAMKYAFIIHLVSISLVTFLAYAYDKQAARRNRWRIPERTLHALALIGGSPGAWVGQKYLRHKTRKQSFQLHFLLIFVVQLVVVGVLWWWQATG